MSSQVTHRSTCWMPFFKWAPSPCTMRLLWSSSPLSGKPLHGARSKIWHRALPCIACLHHISKMYVQLDATKYKDWLEFCSYDVYYELGLRRPKWREIPLVLVEAALVLCGRVCLNTSWCCAWSSLRLPDRHYTVRQLDWHPCWPSGGWFILHYCSVAWHSTIQESLEMLWEVGAIDITAVSQVSVPCRFSEFDPYVFMCQKFSLWVSNKEL